MAKRGLSLGKGLDALLPSSFSVNPPQDSLQVDDGRSVGVIAMVDVHRVRPNPMQPRQDFDPTALEDLKKSIKEKGVIQPITLRRSEDGYEIIAGERRLRASMEVGLEKIPAYILDVETDAEMLELALIENVQRENLNPIEVALGYKRLMEECRLTQEEVSKKVGKDRTTITNFMRLLRLPREIQQSLRAKKLSMGHARAILALSDEAQQHEVFERVRSQELSVRRTEEIVKKVEGGLSVDEALAERPPDRTAAPNPATVLGNEYATGAIDLPLSARTGSTNPAHPRPSRPAITTEGFAIPEDLRADFTPLRTNSTDNASVFTNGTADAGGKAIPSAENTPQDAAIAALETKLRHILATQVRIKMRSAAGATGGVIEIDFYSADEMERLQELFDIIEREQFS
jgi:ParB family transcriptional regulator, chromosome partitioning protein